MQEARGAMFPGEIPPIDNLLASVDLNLLYKGRRLS